MCALVIGAYAYTARTGLLVSSSWSAADNYYNLLVQGFRGGQLNLKIGVPPGLAQLADPYDPSARARYPEVSDMSYYKGKLYLYFGVSPALILFWPYVALTGRYLPEYDAVVIFCLVGFLVSVGLLRALWRRYFADVGVVVVATGTLALGMATLVPVMLSTCDVWEVPISCGYALTMLALAAIWKALHEPERTSRWLVAASAAYGLAVGARPSLLFGAVALLVPVAQAWRERRQVRAVLTAASVPIALIGLGLMLYNALRFNNPFEFGLHYQLAGERHVTRQFFNLHYLWFNFRVYFLEPARWSSRFPFVHDIAVPPLPAGYGWVEHAFGVLTNIPLAWLALAVPLAWRGRGGPTGSVLRGFVLAVALLFGMCALTLALCCWAALRYEVDFLPALLLLAVVGILSLERVLSDRPVWRRSVRWGWGLLLGFSVAFNLLASVEGCAEAHKNWGVALELAGKMQDAMKQYEQALRIRPGDAEAHNHLGAALMRQGKLQEAIAHFEQALLLKTDDAEAHNNLGAALMGQGKLQEAIAHFEQAVRITPDDFKMQYNLGIALGQAGRTPEAIEHYQQALKLRPDFTAARNALARLQARQ
ncbi:MAG: tetratricopeptide repeat protein [Verrucomicrobiia bacterium]